MINYFKGVKYGFLLYWVPLKCAYSLFRDIRKGIINAPGMIQSVNYEADIEIIAETETEACNG